MNKDDNKFEMSVEGCRRAKEYIKSIGMSHLIGREWSTDGYTIVALANQLYKKESKNV